MSARLHLTRRGFLADVGRGALLAGLGSSLSSQLGLAWADPVEAPERLSFGALEPLVALMQETSVEKLLPLLVAKLRQGTDLRTLVAAGALANTRTCGGEDYIGFHTLMALPPAYSMALESPEDARALPVLKVLYRNTQRLQELGGAAKEVLRPIAAGEPAQDRDGGEALRERVRAKDMDGAEKTFAALSRSAPEQSLQHLLTEVEDHVEVHRVVLASRVWDLVSLVGKEHAHSLLRQSVRYCVREEERLRSNPATAVRSVLPAVLEKHGLLGEAPTVKTADDAFIESTSRAIFEATAEEAAEIAGAALAAGRPPEALGEAIALATNELLLRDVGRPAQAASAAKPEGSVHGDSIGVHACDSAHAWRNLARAGTPRHRAACLVLAAYQAAHDRTSRGGEFLVWKAWPSPEEVARVTTTDPAALVAEVDGAIREKNQARACAVVKRYGELGHPPRPLQDVLLRYATSEDGALHAEKYYRTASDEFAAGRPAFRWRHLVALARVTASEYGTRAPGFEEASALLKG